MKRLALVIATICFALTHASAQYYLGLTGSGNPGNVNTQNLEFPVGAGLPSSWSVILGGGNTNPTWSSTQTIPFSFEFNDMPVSQFKVSSTGVLTFSVTHSAVPGLINAALPNSAIPNRSVCIWGVSGRSVNDNIVVNTFGTAPNRQHWISFSDYSLAAVFSNHFTYWSIVLEETTNNIYIVDQRTPNNITTALTVGIQVNDSMAINVAGSPAHNSQAGSLPVNTDNVYHTFIPGSQPNRDLKGLFIHLDSIIAQTDGPFSIRFAVQNLGADTVKTLDLSYAIGAGTKTTSTISGLAIAPCLTDTISHPTLWSPTIGKKTLAVWAENINAGSDEDPSNDTLFFDVNVIQKFADRTPLIESFTSSTSTPSKFTNTQLQTVLNSQTESFTHIKYPMNRPGTGDPYYTAEVGARSQFYSVLTVPGIQIDGEHWSNFNFSITPNTLQQARNKRSLVEMTSKFALNGQQVCVDVEINPLIDLTKNKLTLYIAIYEKATTNNAKNNGETVFYHVMKKMLPDEGGMPIQNLTAGMPYTVNQCFTFNGSYILPPNANSPVDLTMNHTIEDFNNLGVAAWLQNDSTKEVLQSAEAAGNIGVNQVDAEQHLAVYPNPARHFITLNCNTTANTAQLTIVDVTGRVVYNQHCSIKNNQIQQRINITTWPAGIYLVRLSADANSSVKKLIVQ